MASRRLLFVLCVYALCLYSTLVQGHARRQHHQHGADTFHLTMDGSFSDVQPQQASLKLSPTVQKWTIKQSTAQPQAQHMVAPVRVHQVPVPPAVSASTQRQLRFEQQPSAEAIQTPVAAPSAAYKPLQTNMQQSPPPTVRPPSATSVAPVTSMSSLPSAALLPASDVTAPPGMYTTQDVVSLMNALGVIQKFSRLTNDLSVVRPVAPRFPLTSEYPTLNTLPKFVESRSSSADRATVTTATASSDSEDDDPPPDPEAAIPNFIPQPLPRLSAVPVITQDPSNSLLVPPQPRKLEQPDRLNPTAPVGVICANLTSDLLIMGEALAGRYGQCPDKYRGLGQNSAVIQAHASCVTPYDKLFCSHFVESKISDQKAVQSCKKEVLGVVLKNLNGCLQGETFPNGTPKYNCLDQTFLASSRSVANITQFCREVSFINNGNSETVATTYLRRDLLPSCHKVVQAWQVCQSFAGALNSEQSCADLSSRFYCEHEVESISNPETVKRCKSAVLPFFLKQVVETNRRDDLCPDDILDRYSRYLRTSRDSYVSQTKSLIRSIQDLNVRVAPLESILEQIRTFASSLKLVKPNLELLRSAVTRMEANGWTSILHVAKKSVNTAHDLMMLVQRYEPRLSESQLDAPSFTESADVSATAMDELDDLWARIQVVEQVALRAISSDSRLFGSPIVSFKTKPVSGVPDIPLSRVSSAVDRMMQRFLDITNRWIPLCLQSYQDRLAFVRSQIANEQAQLQESNQLYVAFQQQYDEVEVTIQENNVDLAMLSGI